ncbi:MAG: L-carnitine dehydratase/bile acid-inducible protein, partial [Rhizobacter sp.]|nr:L-carnitine dehydratase/bile acid-inducible protein [Rhizobacter sp.]
ALRFEPPFIHDLPGLERSLSFAYYNTSKRSVTLDLDSASGQALFKQLALSADLVIATEKPGVMKARGLDHEELARARPQLVYASITPFGESGPYADYVAEDLIALAMGGLLYLGGYADTPPMRVYGNQGFLCANMYGAVAAMLAVLEAEASGVGQHVDVSMQECVAMALETSVQFYDLEGTVRKRHAGEQRFAGTGVFECADGHVYLMAGGIGANKFWGRTIEWFIEEGMPGVDTLRGAEWAQVDYLKSEDAKRIFAACFIPWSKTKTKDYIYREGQRRRIPVAPISQPADLLSSRQLQYRKYFIEVAHSLCEQPLLMPGAPYKLSATPWRVQRPAPRLGEHNAEVYGELGLDAAELERLFFAKVV